MAAAARELCRRGIARAELMVERDNDRARLFYEKLGWYIVGPLTEQFRYTTPDGLIVTESLDEWLVAKNLARRPASNQGAVTTDRLRQPARKHPAHRRSARQASA